MASRFPAHTRMKSVGTGSLLTSAPDDLSDCPVMHSLFSCIAVSRACCDSILRRLISSMNRTPLLALWMHPASSLSCEGVSSPPDWNGSCLTSPRRAPAWVPVASTNGGISPRSCPTRSLGTIMVSVLWPGVLYIMKMRNAASTAIHRRVALPENMKYTTPMTTMMPMT